MLGQVDHLACLPLRAELNLFLALRLYANVSLLALRVRLLYHGIVTFS